MLAASLNPVAALADEGFSRQELPFSALADFPKDDHLAAFQAFLVSCAAIVEDRAPLRQGVPPSAALRNVCRRALTKNPRDGAEARQFFETNFRPYRIVPDRNGAKMETGHAKAGFLTGYYEPVVNGSLEKTPEFAAPILARPDDLVTLAEGETLPGLPPSLRGARRLEDGTLVPYFNRAEIEAGALEGHTKPLVYLRDPVEVFLIQVQGSARVRLADGRLLRLVYAGRNGQPYSSIGRILIEEGQIAPDAMSLAALKGWIRAHGQKPGEAGAALMARNKSFIFFQFDETLAPESGPIGGAGVSLTPLRSIAVDRTIWAYGLPVWIVADLPWQKQQAAPFHRLMIAQDTGSAIVGPARADIFFGSGDDAGARAGDIRHDGDFIILLPVEEGPDP
jgi:membrane-bound lytic murein transglycosylase A